MKISIITTVFNREKELLRLYNSLIKQKQHNFEWIIVDDGSTDNTIGKLKYYLNNYCKFETKIIEKQNEGKHIALNKALEIVNSDVTVIIDSDDVALPNMIQKINNAWEKNDRLKDNNLAAITFERQDFSGNVLRKIPDKEKRMNIEQYREKNNFVGDYAETFKTSILKKYKFPKFENENFLSEAYIWSDLNKKYDGIFIDDGLYMAEYQKDGLTSKAHKIEWSNPKGTLAVCEKTMPHCIKNFLDIKKLVKYIIFSYRNHKSINTILRKSNSKFWTTLLLFPSYCLYKKMQYKYENRKGEK